MQRELQKRLQDWLDTALLIAAMLCCVSANMAAAEQKATLVELIDKLRAKGHTIIYSSDFVLPSFVVPARQLQTSSIWDLEKIVRPFGLALEYQQGIWYVRQLSSDDRPLESPAAKPVVTDTLRQSIMESVIVTGSRHRLADGSNVDRAQLISESELKNVPAIGGDALRVVMRLPGVASVGVSAKPHIRGGLQDELLILSDGVELLEPFHLADFQSIFSSLDYRTIDSIDFYTGGFPARYGTRMSGVMDITPHNQFSGRQTNIGLSLFSASVSAQGSWDGEDSLSWQLSIRESILDQSLKQVNSRLGKPHYGDVYARINLPLKDLSWAEHADLAIGFLRSEDDVSLQADERTVVSDIESYYLWTKLDVVLDKTSTVRSALALTSHKKQKNGISDEPEASLGALFYNQDTEKISWNVDYKKSFRGAILEFGSNVAYASTAYQSSANIDRGLLANALNLERFVQHNISLKPQGWTLAGYASAEIPMREGLWLQPGIRWDRQDYYASGAEQHWSPRIGLRYQPSKPWRWHISAGQFYQPQGIHELQAIDGETEFYKPQRADQYVAGVQWKRGQLRLDAEIYYKRYGRQSDRYENLFNTFVILPEIEPDRFRVQASKALSKGMDLELAYRFSPATEMQLRYSYLDANEKVEGMEVARRWRQRHTANAIVRWDKDDWSLSAALTWHGGWRGSRLPEEIDLGETLDIPRVLNNDELRNFFSLDLAAAKRWRWGDKELLVYLDVSNVSDRSNIAGLEYAPSVEGGAIVFESEEEVLLPLIPNIGFSFTF